MCEERTRLTEQQIESLAEELRRFLLEHGLWVDTTIYFNGKCFSTYDPETHKFYYNDEEHLVTIEDTDPRDYFEYVNPDHILSMSFGGVLLDAIYYGAAPGLKRKFDQIFEKYGLYYEMGHHWNMTCYYI